MLELPRIRVRLTTGSPPETRQRMIRQTEAFLTLALHGRLNLPRIPRRRVDLGGFGELMQRPGGRAFAQRFWDRVLDAVDVLG